MDGFGNDKGIVVKKVYRKVYTVRISEDEMQILGRSLAAHFNICTQNKIEIPFEHAQVLMDMLSRFKKITEDTKPVIMLKE